MDAKIVNNALTEKHTSFLALLLLQDIPSVFTLSPSLTPVPHSPVGAAVTWTMALSLLPAHQVFVEVRKHMCGPSDVAQCLVCDSC